MASFDVSVKITEHIFQNMEIGKSYTIAARKMNDYDYQITSRENLIFVDNIELVSNHSAMSINNFYKKFFDMIKNVKSPIIISCDEKIPMILQKKSNIFEFVHLRSPKEESEILTIHANLIYYLEMSQCIQKAIKKTDTNESVYQVKEYMKALSEGNPINPQIQSIVKESEGNTDVLFTKLYELTQKNTVPIHNMLVAESIEEISDRLDYETFIDAIEYNKDKRLYDEISKTKDAFNGFVKSLCIFSLSSDEYSMSLECLKVII